MKLRINEDLEHAVAPNPNKPEFLSAFQINRTVIFEVNYYTLGSNPHPYFTTSANKFNRPKTDFSEGGQAQASLLTGKAKQFWNKWDKKHLEDLTDTEYSEMKKDLETLMQVYNYIYEEIDTNASYKRTDISFYDLKKLSMQKEK